MKLPISMSLLVMLCAAVSAPAVATAGSGGESQAASAGAIWSGLLERHPFPYLIPLPEPKRTELDGTYVKTVIAAAERVHCLRCPDYAPEGGIWKLHLDRGVFRIFHPESGWKSIGTYIVADDRLLLANDPACIDNLGLYRWRFETGRLILEAIDDPCAIRLRALNLTQQPWLPCRPPTIEAAVTDHWPKPEGCD